MALQKIERCGIRCREKIVDRFFNEKDHCYRMREKEDEQQLYKEIYESWMTCKNLLGVERKKNDKEYFFVKMQ